MAGTDFTTTITGTVTGFDVSPITNMNNALRAVPAAANQASQAGNGLNTSLTQVGTTTRATGTQFQATGSIANAFGSNINTARGSAQQMVGTNSALGTSFGSVAQGGLSASNTLVPLNTNLQQTAQQSKNTEGSTISLGEKIGLMAGFITTTIGSIGGLIEGFTGLEAAQVAADRAQQRVNTSGLAAEKAQDAYNKVVRQFGPDSRQAQEALVNLHNKQEANSIAQDRAQVTQSRLNEAYLNFGLEVITVAGELAQMGSTLSILTTKLGIKTAAVVVDSDANAANAISAEAAALGMNAEGAAAGKAAGATDTLGFSTLGLGAKFAILAAPLIAAAALFVLIETNTFGMGDAFRSVTPQIGAAIDVIVNGAALIYNAFIKSLEAIIQFGANAANVFIGVENSINTFLDQVVTGFINLGRDIQNAISAVPNFFIDNLINPIIRAWNTFNQSLVGAWQKTVNAIVDFFKPAAQAIVDSLKTIIDAGANIPGALGDPFRSAKKPIDDAAASLKNVGSSAIQTGQAAKTGLTPIKEVADLSTTSFQHLTTSGLYPLNTAVIDASGVIKQLDGTIIQNAGSIKTGAGAALAYGSSWGNLSGIITGRAVPAIKGIIDPIQQTIGGLFSFGQATNTAGAETGKLTGAMAQHQKVQKDFNQTLADSVNKLELEAAGIQKAVAAHQFAQKAIAETGKALQDAASKQQELTTKLTDGTAVQNRYNTAIIEGTNKYLDLIVKTQDAAIAQSQYQAILEQTGAGFAALNLGLDDTVKNMELVTKAALGDKDAFAELQGEVEKLYEQFNKLGDTISSKLGEALDKGKKDFNKALKDLSEETGVNFKKLGEKMAFEVDAGLQNAKKTLDTDLGAMAVLIRQHAPNIAAATEQMIGKLQEQIKGAQPGTVAAWNRIFDDMRRIAAEPIPTAQSIGQLERDMKALNIPADQAQSIMSQLRGTLGGVGTAAGGAAGGITQYSNGVAAAVDLNAGFTRGVSDAIGQLNILQEAGATTFINFIPALAAVAAAMNEAFVRGVGDAIGQLNILQSAAGAVFITIVAGLVQVVNGFNIGFNQAVQAAATALNALTVNVDANAAIWIKAFNAVAVALVTDFNNATRTVGTVMNGLSTNINGNAQNWIKAFNAAATALVNDFNQGTNAAGSAMNSLATNVATNANNMVSRLNNVIGAFNNIRASINNAISAVNSLISRINAIPTQRTVTVTINEIHNITTIQHIIPVIGSVSQTITSEKGTGAPAATTTLLSTAIPAGRPRVIRLEISEPTVVKVDGRELAKQINKKLLELDIGALV